MPGSSDVANDGGLLTEVIEKSSIGIVAFVAERVLLAGFAYVVTTGLGAAAYGFLSVFVRGETISRNLVAGLGDGYSRTLPRASTSAQQTLLTVGTGGFVVVWVIVAMFLVAFRGEILRTTLLRPRHESVIILFALGLLPFLLLRNFRDVFRSLRLIKLAVLVSRVFKPLALLAGAVVVVLLVKGGALLILWISVAVVAVILTICSLSLLLGYTKLTFGAIRSNRAAVLDFLEYTADTTGVAILELVQRRAVFIVMVVYLSPVAAGAFSLSVVVARVVRWPLSGVNGILPPIAARLYDDGQKETLQCLYQQTSRLATVATTPVLIIFSAYAPDILSIFNEAYIDQAIVLRTVLFAQYIATVFGSVGLLLLMTDNERASLVTQIFNASVALPLIVFLTIRIGPFGLGIGYLLSLLINNITELCVLYIRDGFTPFSSEQAYTVLLIPLGILLLVVLKNTLGMPVSLFMAVLGLGLYTWLGQRFLLRRTDRVAIQAWLS